MARFQQAIFKHMETKFDQFHHKQKIMNVDSYPKSNIADSQIERIQEFNFLGVNINENRDWSSHCDQELEE